MKTKIYGIFKKTWLENCDNIVIYSDPHFGDLDINKYFRHKDLFYNGQTDEDIALTISKIDDAQIKSINVKCGKRTCFVCLGDVGNTDYIKKIRAGYKVLITGNHDAGVSNYERKIEIKKIKFALTEDQKEAEHKILTDWGTIDGPGDLVAIQCEQRKYTEKCILENFKSLNILDAKVIRDQKGDILVEYDDKTDTWYYFVEIDNRLFDEVYDGPVFISDKIVLSHEPMQINCALNIHGHDHMVAKDGPFITKRTFATLNDEGEIETVTKDGAWYNCCAESINYTPVQLTNIVDGKTGKIDSIHRCTIDVATEKKLKR